MKYALAALITATVTLVCSIYVSIFLLGAVNAPTNLYWIYACGVFCTFLTVMIKE